MGGTQRTRTFLAPFGYEEIKVVYGEEEDRSAGRLIKPKFPEGVRTEEQGPSNSKDRSEGDDGQGGSRRSEEPMQEDLDQAEKEDDKASTGGISSLDFNFLSDFENNADAGTSVGFCGNEPGFAGEQLSGQFQRQRTKTSYEITKEKKDRRRCQSTLLGNVTRRRVGGASPRP